ncbi:MaoC family dehydratase [Oceanicella actignis]|uniref:MaoC family dehydratase n=1 Tax=Oceanicella actignis TaxID=1189325 RepID=UPI001252C127|nr:MaoC family dehydratase [Oceanicella actignis]TYO90126.1 acyl dehydratase [Oceanicella actignis]
MHDGSLGAPAPHPNAMEHDMTQIQDFDPRERPAPVWTVEQLMAAQGKEIGVSSWIEITQERVNMFAVATDDRNFIHVNPERTRREAGLRGTIAHGFLTLSLLSAMSYEVTPRIEGATLGLNYGVDKARFLTPVPVGARVRGRISLAEVTRKPGALIIAWDAVVEIEGAEVAAGGRPAMIARWLSHITLGHKA